MQLIKAENYEDMSRIAAEIIIRKVRSANRVTLGLATGGTPKGTYERLVADHRQNGT
ncbi:hypothetical protein GCM10011571_16810 [Marinithermofilum abyssi]|uniref:Glucosamine-6-phosphate deaminase n=1 Tax=Marinithermofilum abyssi TaxID=1571185 RepID=A0A8J2YDA7_9BACL|nr:hypothetical protein GCM10011571_16810 [Marinithermofilum abyssi]